MPIGYAVPINQAGSVSSLSTAIAAKPGITAAADSDTTDGDNLMTLIKVTGNSVREVSAAIRADYRAVDVGAATGGTFTLTVDGQTTAAIAYNASASAVKSALEALSTVDTVTVTGVGSAADPWVIVFDQVKTWTVTGTPTLTGGALTVTSPVSNVHVWRSSVIA